MMRRIILACGLVAIPACSAIAAAASEVRAPAYQPGMIIKGDQEAPLVLYVVPWQDPRVPEVPEADLQPVLPRVLDDDLGILQRSRAAGALEVEGASARSNRSK